MNGRDGGARPPSAALPGDLSETAQAVAIARASDAVMVEVRDGFCALVGRPRGEVLGKTADELGISDRARLDWLIDRFPERGRSHRQRRVFETPEGLPRLLDAFPQVSPEIVAAVDQVFAGGDAVVGLQSTGVDGRAYLLTMFPVRLRSTRSNRSAVCSSTCPTASSPSGRLRSASSVAARSWPRCSRPKRWSAAGSPPSSTTTPSRSWPHR